MAPTVTPEISLLEDNLSIFQDFNPIDEQHNQHNNSSSGCNNTINTTSLSPQPLSSPPSSMTFAVCTGRPQLWALYVGIASTSIISILGTVLNLIALVVFIQQARMQPTHRLVRFSPDKVLLVNLVVVDLLYCTVSLPMLMLTYSWQGVGVGVGVGKGGEWGDDGDGFNYTPQPHNHPQPHQQHQSGGGEVMGGLEYAWHSSGGSGGGGSSGGGTGGGGQDWGDWPVLLCSISGVLRYIMNSAEISTVSLIAMERCCGVLRGGGRSARGWTRGQAGG
ncbi:hypothetical protein Pmani_023654, partial [Petrolisthes manimaculis]